MRVVFGSSIALIGLVALNACHCGGAVTTDGGPGADDAGSSCALTIDHSPIEAAPFGDIGVEATVSNADEAHLYFRRSVSGAPFDSLPMTGDGTLRASIPQAALSFVGVDYYIVARSNACEASAPQVGADSPYHIDIYGEASVSVSRDHYDYSPSVHGHQVVFSREEYEGDNVFIFDLDRMSLTQLTSLSSDQGNAEIFAHNVIWDDYRLGSAESPNVDIYLLDLEDNEEHQVTSDPRSQYGSVIDGSVIAWRDDRNMDGPINGDIFVYDLGPDQRFDTGDDGGEFQITSSAADQSSPDVHVHLDGRALVVWHDMRDDSDGTCDANCDQNIYLYDSGPDGLFGSADDSGPTQVTSAAEEQSSAAVGPRWIVWRDARAGDWLHPELYAYDMGEDGVFGNADDGGEQRINVPSIEPDDLDIDGDRLVYDDYRDGSYEIYLYEFSKVQETAITAAYRGQFYPRIHGDVIVWQDARNNDPGGEAFDDVYVYVLPKP